MSETTWTGWDGRVSSALGLLGPHERELLLRVAEARGKRVPISELVSSLGLPPVPSLTQDFPGLSKFVSEQQAKGVHLTLPVVGEGSDEKGWYWMAAEDGEVFRKALS
jgi:hypothetical protein